MAQTYTRKVIDDFAVKTTGPGSLAGSLSGGNLQKFIMGREILQDPELLIVSQPTWGVDAGAAAAIHQAIVDLAENGSAIVVISQDLDELLAITDRMAVIKFIAPTQRYEGKAKRANGYQYPHSVVVGKYLWVISSVNKEDIEVARIPIAELESI